MDIAKFENNLDYLIEKWCSRKQLAPLRRILNAQASINGLTDGLEEMLLELKTIRSQHADELEKKEMDIVIELIHATEAALGK